MAANLKLLDSNGVDDFTSYDFGRVLAGLTSTPKLIFVSSYGDATATNCEFGIYPVSGNDGYTFAQICLGEGFTTDGTTLTGEVSATGGSITAESILSYKISVVDADGHESYIDSNSYEPVLLSSPGNTNKVTLSWDAVEGATSYNVYCMVGMGGSYLKLNSTAIATTSYVDLTGVPGSTEPQTAGSVAYRPVASPGYSSAPLDLGSLTVGTKTPIYVRENVPEGTTSAGNQRHHKTYLAFD